jgi:hypothetical protein
MHRNHPSLEQHAATYGGSSMDLIVENATLQVDHAYPPHTVEGHMYVSDNWLSDFMFHLLIAFEAVSNGVDNNISKTSDTTCLVVQEFCACSISNHSGGIFHCCDPNC